MSTFPAFLPGTAFTASISLATPAPFALGVSPPTATFYRIKSDGTAGAFLRGPLGGVTDVTSPPDANAPVKVLEYTLPNADQDAALPFGDLIVRLIVPVSDGTTLSQDYPLRIVSSLDPAIVPVVPPDSFNPWLTGDGTAQTGISGPTVAVFPYLYNPTSTPTPGFPPIWASLSDVVDPAWLTANETAPDPRFLSVWRSQLLDYVGRVQVGGTWRVAFDSEVSPIDAPYGPGSALIFDPDEAILPNNRYTVHIGRGLPFKSNYYLEETFEWHFLSRLTPFYCDPYAVRMRLGEYSGKVSDEQLYYEIWNASVLANRETLPYVGYNIYTGGPPTQTVLGWQPPRTLAFNGFTMVQSVINITKGLLNRYITEVDRKNQGLDFSTEVADGLIKNLQLSLKILMQEREQSYAEISKRRNNVRTVRPGSFWPGGQGGSRIGVNDRSYRGRRGF